MRRTKATCSIARLTITYWGSIPYSTTTIEVVAIRRRLTTVDQCASTLPHRWQCPCRCPRQSTQNSCRWVPTRCCAPSATRNRLGGVSRRLHSVLNNAAMHFVSTVPRNSSNIMYIEAKLTSSFASNRSVAPPQQRRRSVICSTTSRFYWRNWRCSETRSNLRATRMHAIVLDLTVEALSSRPTKSQRSWHVLCACLTSASTAKTTGMKGKRVSRLRILSMPTGKSSFVPSVRQKWNDQKAVITWRV